MHKNSTTSALSWQCFKQRINHNSLNSPPLRHYCQPLTRATFAFPFEAPLHFSTLRFCLLSAAHLFKSVSNNTQWTAQSFFIDNHAYRTLQKSLMYKSLFTFIYWSCQTHNSAGQTNRSLPRKILSANPKSQHGIVQEDCPNFSVKKSIHSTEWHKDCQSNFSIEAEIQGRACLPIQDLIKPLIKKKK